MPMRGVAYRYRLGLSVLALSRLMLARVAFGKSWGQFGPDQPDEPSVDVDAAAGDGAARLTYRYELLNMTDRPLTRLSRDLWFEYTRGELGIRPLRESTRRVAVQRVHHTPNLSKFACQLSPAIQPGESAVIGYICEGGRFEEAPYWRQAVALDFDFHRSKANRRHRLTGSRRSTA